MSENKIDLFIQDLKSKIPTDHKLIQNGALKNRASKGRDTDTYEYNQIDKDGNIIAVYIIEDSTSTNPPFDQNISYKKKLVTK